MTKVFSLSSCEWNLWKTCLTNHTQRIRLECPFSRYTLYGVNKRNFALVKLGWKISLCIGFSCNAMKQWQKGIFHSDTKSSNCTAENMLLLDRVRFFCFLATFSGSIKKGFEKLNRQLYCNFLLTWCSLKVVYFLILLATWWTFSVLICI